MPYALNSCAELRLLLCQDWPSATLCTMRSYVGVFQRWTSRPFAVALSKPRQAKPDSPRWAAKKNPELSKHYSTRGQCNRLKTLRKFYFAPPFGLLRTRACDSCDIVFLKRLPKGRSRTPQWRRRHTRFQPYGSLWLWRNGAPCCSIAATPTLVCLLISHFSTDGG